MKRALPALVCALAAATPARAQEQAGIEELARDLSREAAAALSEATTPGADDDVAVTVRARDPHAAGRLAQVLEGRLVHELLAAAPGEGAVRSVSRFSGSGPRQAARAGFELWYVAEIVVDDGEVVVLGQLLRTDDHLWRRVLGRDAVGAVARTTHHRAPVSREMAAHLAPAQAAPPVDPRPADPGSDPAPGPRPLAYRATRIGMDPGGRVLDVAAGRLDDATRARLVVLTTDAVLVYGVEAGRAQELSRFSLVGPAPVPFPRTPVGRVVVSGREILAWTSTRGGARLAWQDGALVKRDEVAAPPVYALPGQDPVSAPLWPGTHLLAAERLSAPRVGLPARALTVRAARLGDTVVHAAVDERGVLRVFRARDASPWVALTDAGVALEVADLDRDGSLELVATAFVAPGDPDQLAIRTVAPDGSTRVVYRADALPGAVAAVTSGDFDGDGGTEVAAFVRLADRSGGELWVIR